MWVGNGTQCSRAYSIRLEVGVDVGSSLYQQLTGFIVTLVGGVREGCHAILGRRERERTAVTTQGPDLHVVMAKEHLVFSIFSYHRSVHKSQI